MLFLGIDQHARQLAVSLHDQHGDVLLLARQVSTCPAKVLEFFDQLTQRCAEAGDRFIAVLEDVPPLVSGRTEHPERGTNRIPSRRFRSSPKWFNSGSSH